ncbi:thiol reductant ABC exporter subunit CydC [Vagococcus penaei]|uniref:Thiol reductant ABC exporter subunit CydC n=1 Tax=Vagococcus penaei TaxID=633807 RepID=A0A1Q2D608_9ENTE|nr:thiol reductant ABC exporter subunit CydC [Vagococcus penaei]AQP53697.1 thiol reductant ABC exporter subunit CydC [Vagococcus penaei]RST99446.1 thiol reductant ABC exporter subunit CydC [Vagococcus penaei]
MKKSYLLLSKQDTWVRPYFKKYKKLLALVLFLGVLTFFSAGALMFTSGYLISKSATHPENILMVYVPIVMTRAFGIARPTFRYVERLGSHNWVLKMTSDIRLKLYRSLETRAATAKQTYQSGSLLGMLAEDIDHIQNLYLRTIFPAFISVLLYIFIIIALGVFSIPFALLMFLLMGSFLIVMPLLSILVNNARIYKQKEKRHVLYNELTDAVLGVGDWQYSGRYQEFLNRYNHAEKGVREQDAKMNQYTRYEGLAKQILFGIIVIALFIWAGNYFGQIGSTEALNWIAAFVLAFFPLIDAFAPVSDSIRELPLYEDTVRRLDELPHAEDGVVFDKETVSKEICLTETSIQLTDVSFHYPNAKRLLLDNFSLTIPEGEVIAVLGRSGTGKTTLSKLIRGDLTATAGQLTIGGYPIAEFIGHQSDYIGVLNQSPHLFNTTMANNIRLGNIKATDEEVLEAAYRAGLKPVIDQLPQGMETVVEEGGKRFSGGEQQRIALARILLQDVPIIIIDEPTIGLDPRTEKQLLTTVFETLKGKTVIWITHHLVGIHHANRVIFLQDGQIQMDGSPKELKQTSPYYQQLIALDTYE